MVNSKLSCWECGKLELGREKGMCKVGRRVWSSGKEWIVIKRSLCCKEFEKKEVVSE